MLACAGQQTEMGAIEPGDQSKSTADCSDFSS